MAQPTESDFINAHIVTNRILLKKLFQELRDRPQSKYFKNVIIKDIDWNKKTLKNKMPINFPHEFLKKYPYDFEINFTVLGCNMLKCYKHKKTFCPTPVLINKYLFACNEACFSVYNEFNDYLKEKFDLNNISMISDNNNNDDDNNILPFETFSIHDSVKEKNYCGIQLTPLKTFSILPSSRWWNDENISAKEYVEKHKHLPLQLRELSGLVDAPPLTWNKQTQNVHFNRDYCKRFNKKYDETKDYCHYKFLRKGVNYLFGENFINMFPDLEQILLDGSVPFEHLHAVIQERGLDIDKGYEEIPIQQKELEKQTFNDIPDRITKK